MSDPRTDDLLSRAGHLLWRDLPEEYRYRDNPVPAADPADREPGDLEAFLHGMGHLLDLIRGTTEQLYADGFAEAADAGAGGRRIQPWLLPYLAELVGAELAAPDPAQRVAELNAAVRWFKSKGTLASVDELGDVVTGVETVAREGWRGLLTCPRVGLPPFSLPPEDSAGATAPDGRPRVSLAGDPSARALRPGGCPDFRRTDRAVLDPAGGNPLYRLTQPARDADGVTAAPRIAHWRPRAPGGVPCFPGGYDDGAARTPDLRDPARTRRPGPHPRRTLIHVRPPDGLFAAGLKVLEIDAARLMPPAGGTRDVDPREAFRLAGTPLAPEAPAPDRVIVKLSEDLRVTAGRRLRLTGILLVGDSAPDTPARVLVRPGGQLAMTRSAARRVVLEGPGPEVDGRTMPNLEARDSLFGAIAGGVGFARLEYCTVAGETDVTILQASDCLLGALTDNLNCATPAPGSPDPATCLRFSRAAPPPGAAPGDCLALRGGANTADRPDFAPRWHCPEGGPVELRPPAWGEPGHGVLSVLCPASIRHGAEDEGEMGAHHHQFHAAGLAALERKLAAFLPLGQEVALIYDPMLAMMPPEAGA